jgi:hypothetical protein
MELPILILWLIAVLSLILGFSSLDHKLSIFYISVGFVLLISYIVVQLFEVLPAKTAYMFLLLISIYFSQMIAFPLLNLKAGRSFTKVNDVTRGSKRWLLILLAPIVLWLLITIIPSYVPYSGEGTPYNMEYFTDRIPFWAFGTCLLVYVLLSVYSKTHMREKGIVQFNRFIGWKEIASYSWYELDDKLRLSIKVKPLLGSKLIGIIYLVSNEQKQLIDELLKSNINKEVSGLTGLSS